jgi:hypothetical protein
VSHGRGACFARIPTAVTMEDKLNLTSNPQFAMISPKWGHGLQVCGLQALGIDSPLGNMITQRFDPD